MSDERDAALGAVERQLARLLQATRQRWRELAAQVHPELQPAGYKVLTTLADGGPALAKELAETLVTDKSVLSRQVAQLERLGLVERHVDARDGRARHIAATPLAVERLAAVRGPLGDALRVRLAGWETAEVRTFAELLGRLADATPDDVPGRGDVPLR